MNTEKEIKELEKNRRASARAIPIYTGLFIVAAITLWTVGMFFPISVWVTVIVLGLTAFTLIGDIFNYYSCGRGLRRLKDKDAR
jgi:UDP-N-acetylmuramyl pentapeptide phosphotransferase/UDP-N-acetylglucosamine-1-phosphate transferase